MIPNRVRETVTKTNIGRCRRRSAAVAAACRADSLPEEADVVEDSRHAEQTAAALHAAVRLAQLLLGFDDLLLKRVHVAQVVQHPTCRQRGSGVKSSARRAGRTKRTAKRSPKTKLQYIIVINAKMAVFFTWLATSYRTGADGL